MAPRRSYLRVALLVFVTAVVIFAGAGHSLYSLIMGSQLDSDALPDIVSPVPTVADVSQPDMGSSGISHAPVFETDRSAPTAATSVWNFTHKKSRADAVTTVRGHLIEPIHPFLKKKSGGRWIGIHPTDLRLSLLLPKVADTLLPSARLVYIDLGARMYPGSTGWFLKHYPRSREFNAVLFELLELEHTYTAAKPYFRSFVYERKAAWTHDRGVQIKGMRMARVDDNVVVQRGDNRQTWQAPSVDMANYIMSNFTKDDFVALKLDIEGGEWTLLPHLIRSGAMEYIDELFFECHPIDFDDYVKEPNRLPSICVDFINDLRSLGVYCHRWF